MGISALSDNECFIVTESKGKGKMVRKHRIFAGLFLLFTMQMTVLHSAVRPEASEQENHRSVNKKPYVILVSFDGFRWDYMKRGLTPHLDSIAAAGVSALSLRPSFPSVTFPNHYSIISGMYPENHGIILNDFTDKSASRRYRLSDTMEIRQPDWYKGEAFWETARKQGIITASYFWPGSEMHQASRRPEYYQIYEHKRDYGLRVQGITDWLKLPYSKRPHFLTLYFDATDSYGHRFGPDSPEVNRAISQLDSITGLLCSGLKAIGMADSVDLIIVSDHGMTEVSPERVIFVGKLLSGAVDTRDITYSGEGGIIMLDAPKSQLEGIYRQLKSTEDHYRVYKKNEVPEYYHFSKNRLISPIVLIAETGWILSASERQDDVLRHARGGKHGYDNNQMDMHGILIASGPDFKKGYRTGTLWNIDIYPMLCRIFNIKPSEKIDGKSERIEFILRQP